MTSSPMIHDDGAARADRSADAAAHPSAVLTRRYVDALDYTAILHATQVRKGSTIPYMSHLLAVSAAVLESGGTETEAIAGLLHDAAEDQGGAVRLADIRVRFGDEVAHIVAGCTDSWSQDAAAKDPWCRRKSAYVAHLLDPQTSRGTLLVAACDKLHNAASLLADARQYANPGDFWRGRFSSTPAQAAWYYRSCLDAFVARELPPVLLTRLTGTTDDLVALIDTIPTADRGEVSGCLRNPAAACADCGAA